MATSLKRILEINEDLSNKRVKMCTEIGHFYEVQSNKNVITVGRNSSDYWKSSYQRYRLSYYGGYRGRNRCVKSRIGSKKKEGDGKKENIENAEYTEDTENSENIEDTENIENTEDIDIIEELFDWQPTIGSDAFNEGFGVSVLNGIEAFVEEGEIFNSVSGDDEGVNISICNNEDEEVFEVLEVLDENYEEYQEDEEYDIDEDNYDYEIEENSKDEIFTENDESKKRNEALNRELNFGNSEICRVMHKLIIVEIFL